MLYLSLSQHCKGKMARIWEGKWISAHALALIGKPLPVRGLLLRGFGRGTLIDVEEKQWRKWELAIPCYTLLP
jgi:hypothetical protein